MNKNRQIEVFMIEIASNEGGNGGGYTPERGSGNEHARKNWGWLIAFTLGCAAPVIFIQVYAAYHWWPNDPFVELRWLSKTLLKLFIAIACAEIYLTYRDWRVNGNLFKGIIQNPLGCAIFAGACVYGIVLICISSVL